MLPREAKHQSESEKGVPCCVCSGSTSDTAVWAFPMCYPCATAWGKAAPTFGDLRAAKVPDTTEAMRDAYQSRIRAWIAERRAVAA